MNIHSRLGRLVGDRRLVPSSDGDDSAFRPAWSQYHRLWEVHTGGWSHLHAVWLTREPLEFEEARRAVLPIMLGVLERQPRPASLVGRVMKALASAAASADPVAIRTSAD